MIVAPKRDPNFALNPIHGEWAQHRFMNAVLARVPQRRLALDVGAHIGLWTRALAIKFAYVVAFEPVPENYACLVQNASFRNTRLENVALGDTPGTAKMILPTKSNSGCWYAQTGSGGDTPMTTIDSFGFNEVDLIKIDVEGFEGDVIHGACATLSRCRPVVVFEVNGLGAKHYGPNWLDPTLTLAAWRYKFIDRHGKNEIWGPC